MGALLTLGIPMVSLALGQVSQLRRVLGFTGFAV